MSLSSLPLRPLIGAVAAVAAVSVFSGGGTTAMGFAKQAGAAAAAVMAGDMYKASYGDGSAMSMATGLAASAGTFAAVNKLVLGTPDSWTTLMVAGAVIDTVASFVENPIGNALGL